MLRAMPLTPSLKYGMQSYSTVERSGSVSYAVIPIFTLAYAAIAATESDGVTKNFFPRILRAPAQHSEIWIPRPDLHVTISVTIECGSESILDVLILDADTISI